jgi:hypothetical protein
VERISLNCIKDAVIVRSRDNLLPMDLVVIKDSECRIATYGDIGSGSKVFQTIVFCNIGEQALLADERTIFNIEKGKEIIHENAQ